MSALSALGAVGAGFGESLGGGPSGVTDAGLTEGSGRNVLISGGGSFGNLGEIIRATNEGSVENGGWGVPRFDRLRLPAPDFQRLQRSTGSVGDVGAQRAGFDPMLLALAAGGVGLFLLLRNR